MSDDKSFKVYLAAGWFSAIQADELDHLEQICDESYDCKDDDLKFCSEDNCSQGSDQGAKCCGGKMLYA